ncbi:MAG: cytochrome c oxidase subunit II [Hydrogenibacillus sp.]|nr:cytochrome c oxidase subunit II [Hydrogenibacillus sp.]
MAFGFHLHPASSRYAIDPTRVNETPPFDQPGLYAIGPNEYRAVIIAKLFTFIPSDLTIPKGATVHFMITSPDVIHGLSIPGTNVNIMVIPGQVNTFTYTFKRAGEYLLLCNEYCGAGHQMMMAKWTVKEE